MTTIFPIMHFKCCCFYRKKVVKTRPLRIPFRLCECVNNVRISIYMRESNYSFMPYTCYSALCMFSSSSFRLFKYFSVGVAAHVHLVYFIFPISHTLLGLHMAIMRRFDCHYQQHAQCSLRCDHLFISLARLLCLCSTIITLSFKHKQTAGILHLKFLPRDAINITYSVLSICAFLQNTEEPTKKLYRSTK